MSSEVTQNRPLDSSIYFQGKMGELAQRKSNPTQALPQTKQGIYESWGNPLGMLGTLECKGSPCRLLEVWGLLYTGYWGSLPLEHLGLSPPSVLTVLFLPQGKFSYSSWQPRARKSSHLPNPVPLELPGTGIASCSSWATSGLCLQTCFSAPVLPAVANE